MTERPISERLELRVYSPAARPTLVYLPGLHGDWTLIGGFRSALGERMRFVEITYPRTLTWSLEQYAEAIEQELARHGIAGGWLLGESFGSQVLWALAGRKAFKLEGIILAGGFVRHPMRYAARLAGRVAGGIPMSFITRMFFAYASIARFRFRHSPEVLAGVEEFIARRTELDRQAARHRLDLIAQCDPCAIARSVSVPVCALTGLLDPIVPWYWVRRWLKRHCPNLRDYRIIPRADHTVLATAPAQAAEQVAKWIGAN
jgi:pimeloyl-ACP methyl ester carboxylesterase